ncbi:MAG: nucleotide sugar dehydrogenase, partial [Anaerolineae bacterium]|nr:nucleotide sugar dehydrogenase [Anaerolineae bacterium]
MQALNYPLSTIHYPLPTPDNTVIGVVGLGYVGLPVACEFARVGFRVIGVDLKADRVAQINAGISPIEGNEPGLAELLAEVVASGKLHATTDYAKLSEAKIITVNVETPVDDNHVPQYHALRAATRSLSQVIQPETLIIIESTVAPGTTLNVVKPILEESGKWQVASGRWQVADTQAKIYLGMCPERVMPGLLLQNLRNLSRACGGCTPEIAQAMVALYRHIIPSADLDATDILTAELVKTTENAYRDVQIAFANEVALICEAVGGDVWKVRQLVNKSPGRNMLLAGAGVGGHCIPKDPWLLAAGVNLKLKMENEK